MRLGTIIFTIYMEGKKDYIPLSLSLCSLSIFIIYFLVRVNVFLSIVQVMSSPILPHVKHDSRITTICTWFFIVMMPCLNLDISDDGLLQINSCILIKFIQTFQVHIFFHKILGILEESVKSEITISICPP